MGFKYVMLQHKESRFPFIFPDSFVHAEVAELAMMLAYRMGLEGIRPVSAGTIGLDGVHCSGDSETLKLESMHEVDEKIIQGFTYFHGMNFPEAKAPSAKAGRSSKRRPSSRSQR